MLVWSGRCDSLAGGQPEHAYTDGVGGMAAAGWNHTGRGSMPTQEAKFPVDLCAFHVSLLIVRNSAAEVEEFSRCCCEYYTSKRGFSSTHNLRFQWIKSASGRLSMKACRGCLQSDINCVVLIHLEGVIQRYITPSLIIAFYHALPPRPPPKPPNPPIPPSMPPCIPPPIML